jgi:GT2 family glycosyltransferase
MLKVAALLTCFNRKEKTIACLEQLYKANISKLSVFLVDDGSSDGTEDAVRQQFPEVIILKGDGNLFWNGGMYKAFAAAIKIGFTHYLWLNDDTLLYENAWNTLKESASIAEKRNTDPYIIVGSTCDPENGKLTYGGLVRNNPIKKLRFDLVKPSTELKPCETINGNCVLISAAVVERIGNLDPFFTHAIGDFDYGLRAKKANCSIWVAPKFIGTCSKNPTSGTWQDKSLKTPDRIKAINSTKGLPNKEWKEFAKRYAGIAWPIYWLSPFIKIYLEQLTGKKK